jgi:Domain of unknown function (DUF4336)
MLERIDEGIWSVRRPFSVAGLQLGTRMTALRLTSGGLLLYSPVRLDDELRGALVQLGRVEQILAPSKVHHLFAADYVAAYPDAELIGAPGLPDKRKDLSFAGIVDEAAPPVAWSGVLEPFVLGGAPMMNEVMLLHPATRTLIVTDVAFNIEGAGGWWTKSYLRMMGALGGFRQSRMVHFAIRDKQAARASFDRVLARDFERIVVTHGEVFEQGGRAALEQVCAWL